MKPKVLILIVVIIAAIIIAALLYVMRQPRSQMDHPDGHSQPTPAQTPTPSSPPAAEGGQPTNQTPGTYVAYSEAAFAEATDARRVLFFHAPWCPQCRALEKSIQEGQIPANMVILKVDYDSATQLRQQYGVTLQTTMVEVGKNGELKQKFVAYDEPSLAAVVRALGQ